MENPSLSLSVKMLSDLAEKLGVAGGRRVVVGFRHAVDLIAGQLRAIDRVVGLHDRITEACRIVGAMGDGCQSDGGREYLRRVGRAGKDGLLIDAPVFTASMLARMGLSSRSFRLSCETVIHVYGSDLFVLVAGAGFEPATFRL